MGFEGILAALEHLDAMIMTQKLLAYLSSDFTEDDVVALEGVAKRLIAEGRWLVEPPVFVDDTDSSSCTRPEDEPVRTVGVVLTVNSLGEAPETPVTELERLLDALSAFSRERQVELELLLDDTYVGEIRDGNLDRLLREGLLEQW